MSRTLRPVFLNPLKVRLPVTATVSLAHRLSGLLLLAALPLAVWAMARVLDEGPAAERWRAVLQGPLGTALLLLLTWATAHHVAAGVRHLLFDAGVGTHYPVARRSAWAVHAVALALTLAAAAARVLA